MLTEGKNDDDPSGWWPATVKMMKGEFYVVDYKIQDETKYSDIVPSDRIRMGKLIRVFLSRLKMMLGGQMIDMLRLVLY